MFDAIDRYSLDVTGGDLEMDYSRLTLEAKTSCLEVKSFPNPPAAASP